MDIARHGDAIKEMMDVTKIDRSTHDRKSFLEAIDSNWSPHNSDTEFSEHKSRILSAATKLGMQAPFNEISFYAPKTKGLKLQIIILGSHPKQLCSFLSQLIQFRYHIHQTIMIGSSTLAYDDTDYLDCDALNASQRLQLTDMARHRKLRSDQDIMRVYFNDLDLNPTFPVMSDSQQGELKAVFRNNYLLLTYLENNTHMNQLHSSVIIAAPQPYMPETVSILRKKMKNATLYRFASVEEFSIYESLNALRSWLQTDFSLTQ